MIERAIEKIKAEMENNKDNGNVQIIGDFLLKQIEINNVAAKSILTEGKTIVKSISEMEKIAMERIKSRTGTQCIAIDPNEGFKIIMKYFEFEAVQDKILEVEVDSIKEVHNIQREETINKDNIDFDVNLDDLLS